MSRNKAVGTRKETEVVDYLRTNGHPYVERRANRGKNDAGDIAGLPGWAVEVKRCNRLELGEWAKEAEREAKNAGVRWWAVVHHRRSKNVADSYVTMPLSVFAEITR